MQDRVRTLDDAPTRPGRYVLYRMRVNRRAECNHALAYAIELANRLNLPVLCSEEPDDRFPGFVLDGVPEMKKRLARLGIGYAFGVDGKARLAEEAAAIVTDDWPLPAADPCHPAAPCFAVDSSCIVPMSRMEKREYGTYLSLAGMHRKTGVGAYIREIDNMGVTTA